MLRIRIICGGGGVVFCVIFLLLWLWVVAVWLEGRRRVLVRWFGAIHDGQRMKEWEV